MAKAAKIPSYQDQTDFIAYMKAKVFGNGEARPTPAQLKDFLDQQAPYDKNAPDDSMGPYAWGAVVLDVSSKTVRTWCSDTGKKTIPYAAWVVLRLAAGRAVNVVNPLSQQLLEKGPIDLH